jgi:hypothetical protein
VAETVEDEFIGLPDTICIGFETQSALFAEMRRASDTES